MLILTRRIGENIVIGDDIIIRVVDIRGNVKLGIEAPREITVHREEIHERIQNEKMGESIGDNDFNLDEQ